VGSAYLPVTGGLFLGSDATNALSNTNGRFWVTQDQRHTIHGRIRYRITDRLWTAWGTQFGGGLPLEFDTTDPNGIAQAIAQYGAAVVDRVNFAAGRVKPSFTVDGSAGVDLWVHDQRAVRLQADVQNLNNRLNVIDFAGLFSGNAIAPPRSWALRLQASF
jgi:hypothetical protein